MKNLLYLTVLIGFIGCSNTSKNFRTPNLYSSDSCLKFSSPIIDRIQLLQIEARIIQKYPKLDESKLINENSAIGMFLKKIIDKNQQKKSAMIFFLLKEKNPLYSEKQLLKKYQEIFYKCKV